MKVGIIGYGVIGSALGKACIAKGIAVSVYDKFKTDFNDPAVLENCDIIFGCVPTPTTNGQQDVSAVLETLVLLNNMKYQGALILRSTLVPGCTENYQKQFPELNIAHCPEFLTAASPLEDLIKQPVVLVGGSNQMARIRAQGFWHLFDKKTPVKTFDSATTSEMCKYFHNIHLATKVSLFNDFAEICEKLGVTYEAVLDGALSVGQIGRGHTKVPGPDGERGYGGMCFPKDMNALATYCDQNQIPAETIKGAIAGNKRRRGL